MNATTNLDMSHFTTSPLPLFLLPPPLSLPPPPPPSSPPDALALNKEMEFSAIQGILRHLDDNADGSVDLRESEEVHRVFTGAERRGRGREGGRWLVSVGVRYVYFVPTYVYAGFVHTVCTC